MATKLNQPIITGIKWGQTNVKIGNQARIFRDCCLQPGAACNWDWVMDGTRHEPGILATALEPLLKTGNCKHIILSTGMNEMLKVHSSTLQMLTKRGITYTILETREAVKLYNQMVADGVAVGGLFHSTC